MCVQGFFFNQVRACLRNYSKEGVSKLSATSCLFFILLISLPKVVIAFKKWLKNQKNIL